VELAMNRISYFYSLLIISFLIGSNPLEKNIEIVNNMDPDISAQMQKPGPDPSMERPKIEVQKKVDSIKEKAAKLSHDMGSKIKVAKKLVAKQPKRKLSNTNKSIFNPEALNLKMKKNVTGMSPDKVLTARNRQPEIKIKERKASVENFQEKYFNNLNILPQNKLSSKRYEIKSPFQSKIREEDRINLIPSKTFDILAGGVPLEEINNNLDNQKIVVVDHNLSRNRTVARVAILQSSNNQETVAAMANALIANDYEAVPVSPEDLDELEEALYFDAFVIGGSGYTNDELIWAEVYEVIHACVNEYGRGLVHTGWGMYSIHQGSDSYGFLADMLPLNPEYNFLSGENNRLTEIDVDSPLMDGVTNSYGAFAEYSTSGIREGAEAHAWYSNGYEAVVSWSYGLGHVVNLGHIYMAAWSYQEDYLVVDTSFFSLLKNSINWSAGVVDDDDDDDTGNISGIIVDQNGNVVDSAFAYFWSVEHDSTFGVEVNEQGEFSVDLIVGPWSVYGISNDSTQWWDFSDEGVHFVAPGSDNFVELVLTSMDEYAMLLPWVSEIDPEGYPYNTPMAYVNIENSVGEIVFDGYTNVFGYNNAPVLPGDEYLIRVESHLGYDERYVTVDADSAGFLHFEFFEFQNDQDDEITGYEYYYTNVGDLYAQHESVLSSFGNDCPDCHGNLDQMLPDDYVNLASQEDFNAWQSQYGFGAFYFQFMDVNSNDMYDTGEPYAVSCEGASDSTDATNMTVAYSGDVYWIYFTNFWCEAYDLQFFEGGECVDEESGFAYLGEFNGHHYYSSMDSVNWYDGLYFTDTVDVGEEAQIYMATISSQEENDFIHNAMDSVNNPSVGSWIGFTDEMEEGNWQWVNGEEVIYTNWSEGEPGNDNGMEHYAEIMPNGAWNDLSYEWELRFIVELELDDFDGGVVLNEFLASSENCCGADIFGSAEDFVELYNNGSEWVSIEGWGFSDESGAVTTVAPDTGIYPGEHLVVWYTGDANGFPEIDEKLSADGETIYIEDSEGNVVVDFSFGMQYADTSFGSYPDGSDNWQFMVPTPGGPNLGTNNEPVYFEKEDYADYTDPVNWDHITGSVAITRANNQGLFNPYYETGYNGNGPSATLWSPMPTDQSTTADYMEWVEAVNYSPPSVVGETISLWCVEENQFFDIYMESWTEGNNGGGFSYWRFPAEPPVGPGLLIVSSEFGNDESGDGSFENPFASIGSAVSVMNDGDIILVLPGIYQENISVNNMSGMLVGLSGPDSTFIDGGGQNKIMEISDGDWMMGGFTFANGYTSGSGGAVSIYNGSLFMGGSMFMNNTAEYGGALEAINADVFIDSSRFIGNSANGGSGGALRVLNVDSSQYRMVSVSNTLFAENSASEGQGAGAYLGAFEGAYMDAYLDMNEFKQNAANNYAGLRVNGAVYAGIYKNDFAGNEAQTYAAAGGFSGESSVYVDYSLIAHNHANLNGGNANSGGFSVWSGSYASFNFCTFVGNEAAYGSALTVGGGSYADVNYSIVWNNPGENSLAAVQWDNNGSSLYVYESDIQFGENGGFADTLSYIDYYNIINAPPFFCDPQNGDFSIDEFSPAVTSWGEPMGSSGFGCSGTIQASASILSVEDIPSDQGGRVYITFEKSLFDTDGLSRTEMYTVERLDGDQWVGLNSVGAYGSNVYVVEATTLADSTSENNALTTYRVIANMDEGNFESDPASGYSVDNIAPAMVTGLDALLADGVVTLTWNNSEANDFLHYMIYQSSDPEFFPGDDTVLGTNTSPSFQHDVEEIGEYYYIVSAVDIHENEGDHSEVVNVTLLSLEDAHGLPDNYALHQNYPNPFNPVTTLRYDLPEDSDVSITIYDMMGRQISTLVNEYKSAGYHSVQWKGTNYLGFPVSAGVYIYIIETGEYRSLRKMILLK